MRSLIDLEAAGRSDNRARAACEARWVEASDPPTVIAAIDASIEQVRDLAEDLGLDAGRDENLAPANAAEYAALCVASGSSLRDAFGHDRLAYYYIDAYRDGVLVAY